MSIVIKAFASNSATKNNLPNRTGVFGELSAYARTFSREITEYALDAYPSIELNVFSSLQDGLVYAPPPNVTNMLLEISAWVYERGLLLAGSSSATIQDFVAAFENRFSGFVNGVTTSPLRSDGNYRIPELLNFTLTPNAGIESSISLWFGNDSFENDYDAYEIVVVPPVEGLSVFFQSRDAVQTALAARPIDTMMGLVDTAKAKKPPSHIVTQTVTWYNISQPAQSLTCTWFMLIYGPRGNNSNATSQALTNFILANSTQSVQNWKVVMPDLFWQTQFTILPRWDNYAIAPTSIAGIYAPYGKVSEMLTFAQSKLSSLNTTFIANTLETTHHPYRSIQLLSVPGEDNRLGATSLEELIPDYIGQESIGEDFNRQSAYTRQWVTEMGNLLRVAELYGKGATLQTGMRVVEHLGLECVSMKIRDVEFLVALKRNYAPV